MITLIEPTDPCAMCEHPRFMHMESEYWNDSGDWYWVYEECTEQGCDCQMFQEPEHGGQQQSLNLPPPTAGADEEPGNDEGDDSSG